MDPGCYCNGGADLGAAAESASCHQTMKRMTFSWIYPHTGQPGMGSPAADNAPNRMVFEIIFLRAALQSDPRDETLGLSRPKNQCHIPAAKAGLAQAKNLQKATCSNMIYISICILLIAYATITIFGNHDSYFPACAGKEVGK